MTRNLLRASVAAICSATISSGVMASGLFLPEGASAGYGMAGAGDGVNTDSAAVMWANPAAMAGLEGEMLTINGTLFDLSLKYEDHEDPSKDSPNAGRVLPTGGVFYALPLDEKMTMGLALSSSGGSAYDYSDWSNNPYGAALAEKGALANLQFNPSLSYRLNDKWSIGGGIQFNYTLLVSESSFYPTDSSALKLDQTGDFGVGFNLGVFFQPSDKVNLGLSYRSGQEHTFSDSGELLGQSRKYSYEFSPFVDQIDLSGSIELNDKWKLLGSIGWQKWSDMDSSTIYLEEKGNNDLLVKEIPVVRNWDDTWKYSVGVQYILNKDWTLKTGVTYETSPLDDATLQTPDMPMDRQIRFAVGATTSLGKNWTVDMYYEYADMGEPDIYREAAEVGENGVIIPGVNGKITDYNIHFIGAAFTRKF